MKCIILIEDELTDRGGWADIMPNVHEMSDELAGKILLMAYKRALKGLMDQPIQAPADGIIDLIRQSVKLLPTP